MMELTLVLSVYHFGWVFSHFKTCKIVLPLPKGLFDAKIVMLAPGRCQKVPSVVQRVKYWYYQLGRVFLIVINVL